jgi:hydroxymethylglutaryl-CoA reductase (NADPH)
MEAPDLNGNAVAGGLGLDLGALYKELAPLERLQRLAEGRGVRWAAPVAAKHIVRDAVKQVGSKIVRDYAIEIAVLLVGAASGIGGLREFCYLGTSPSRSCGKLLTS